MKRFTTYLKEEKDKLGHGSDTQEGTKLKHITHPDLFRTYCTYFFSGAFNCSGFSD